MMREAIQKAEQHRAYLHTIPEPAYHEVQTTACLKKVCAEYPVEFVDHGMETGLVVFLNAGRDRTVALRADIDAVPTEHGAGHLCGHDGHAAALLGCLHHLAGIRDRLPHNVLFIFQPAEEPTTGAAAMLAHGLWDRVPQRPFRLFGMHSRPEVPCGDVVIHRGALMAEKSNFTVAFHGRAGHGSAPHLCVDPIVAAGSFISGLQTVVSRNISPFDPAVCAVNSVTAGQPDCSAPEDAVLTGTIRSLSRGVHECMSARVRQLAEDTAEAYGCRCLAEIVPMVPAVRNSEEMTEIARRAAEAAVGRGHITDSAPCLASEDFSVLAQDIPYFFYWVGSGTPGQANAAWHDPDFRLAPHWLETAVPLLVMSALEA